VILISGIWHCQSCGETGPVDPLEEGEMVSVEHDCLTPDENW